ncbi:MAG: universal stress protein [Bacteroidales bacterium]|nr:universal stress protein [Bacteroidales bacterium]MDD4604510.1 universal stress protein [Bacteroidales bacterium]
MNKIIVAIDFSDCSINAFLHAISIAQHCQSDLILVWVDKSVDEKEKYIDRKKDPSQDVQKAFEELIAKYQPELPEGKISFVIRHGKVYKEVTAEAKTNKAMLIVVGTHGASGFEEFWIGSNANKIVAASSCPVITIRAGINIAKPLRKIVVPIDGAEETRQKASFTAYLAKRHDAEVFVIKLYTSKIKEVRKNVDLYASQVIRYFDDEKVKYHVDALDAENISDAMIDYAKVIGANLISIMTEQETTTANIFLGPYAHQTVNHSSIPVLSIHPKETLSGTGGF